jgi:hypothetical protein
MRWRWPRGSGIAATLVLGLGLAVTGCGEAPRSPTRSESEQRQAEEAMPEMRIFRDDREEAEGDGLLAPLGSPGSAVLGGAEGGL